MKFSDARGIMATTVRHGRSPMRLGARIMRSARWALVESLLSAGSSMLTVILLARFLQPAEFGAAGLAVAVSAIAQAALLGGMPDALVRAPSIHGRLIDAAFWWFVAIGAGASLVAAAAALFAWQVLGQAQLAALIAVQGLSGVAIGAAAAPTGLLIRKMRTQRLVQRTLVAKVVTLAVSISLAWRGWGAWAIVLGGIAGQFGASVQLIAATRRPRFRLRDPAVAATLRIGMMAGVQSTIGTITTRGFIIVFGAVYGAHAVGLLNFAVRLVEESCGLVINTLRRVTITSFAAARRRGLDIHTLFMRGTNMIAYVAAPLFLGIAAVAPDAVPLLFGAQWSPAVPALQLMLAMWVIRSTRMLVNAIMVVDGRQKAMVAFALIGLAATAAAFLASLPLGMAWSTAAYAATLSGMIFGGAVFRRQTGLTMADQIRAGLTPILFATLMCALVAVLRVTVLASLDPVSRLLASIAAGAAAFASLAVAFDRGSLRALAAMAARR